MISKAHPHCSNFKEKDCQDFALLRTFKRDKMAVCLFGLQCYAASEKEVGKITEI
jgi:hypothetical protein